MPLTWDDFPTVEQAPQESLTWDDFPEASAAEIEPGYILARTRKMLDSYQANKPDYGFAAEQLRDVEKFVKAVPFFGDAFEAGTDIAAAMRFGRIRDRKASMEDYVWAAKYLKDKEALGQQSVPEDVRDTLIEIPGFVTEFAATGGVYTVLKKLAKKGLQKVIGEATEQTAKSIGRKVVEQAVPAAVGLAGQTVANPQRVAASTAQMAMPEIKRLVDPEGRVVGYDIGDDESFLAALPAGFLDAAIELGSERSGAHLAGAAGSAFSKLPGAAKVKALKEAATRLWLSKPGRTAQTMQQVLAQGGWHGVIGEMLEERAGDVSRLGTGLQSPEENVVGKVATGDFDGAGRQLLVELLAFSVPGAVNVGVKALGPVDEQVEVPSRAAELIPRGDQIEADYRKEQLAREQERFKAEQAIAAEDEAQRQAAYQRFTEQATGVEQSVTPVERRLIEEFYSSPDQAAEWVAKNPEGARKLLEAKTHYASDFTAVDPELPFLQGRPGDAVIRNRWKTLVEQALAGQAAQEPITDTLSVMPMRRLDDKATEEDEGEVADAVVQPVEPPPPKKLGQKFDTPTEEQAPAVEQADKPPAGVVSRPAAGPPEEAGTDNLSVAPSEPATQVTLQQAGTLDIADVSDDHLRRVMRLAKTSGSMHQGDVGREAAEELQRRGRKDYTEGPLEAEPLRKRVTDLRSDEEARKSDADRIEREHKAAIRDAVQADARARGVPMGGRGEYGLSAAKKYQTIIQDAKEKAKSAKPVLAALEQLQAANLAVSQAQAKRVEAENAYNRAAAKGYPSVPVGQTRKAVGSHGALTVLSFDQDRGMYRVENLGGYESWIAPQPLLDNYATDEELAEAKAVQERIEEAFRQKAAEADKVRQAEAKQREAEAAKARREKAREGAREALYWRSVAQRGAQVKGQKSTITMPLVKVKDGPAEDVEVPAEVLSETWAIAELPEWDDSQGKWVKPKLATERVKAEFSLTHRPTGLLGTTAGSPKALKELWVHGQDAGIDWESLQSEKEIDEQREVLVEIKRAWNEKGLYFHTNEGRRKKILASVPQSAPLPFEADITLGAAELGYGTNEEADFLASGRLKELADTVPEFRYNPVLTVDSKLKLIFRDGFKFTFAPEQFNLAEGELTPGQTVAINLPELGIKLASEQDVVAEVLKNQGFANIKRPAPDKVVASWKHKAVTVTQEGEHHWTAAGPEEAAQRATETLARIRWIQPGQADEAPSKGKLGPSLGGQTDWQPSKGLSQSEPQPKGPSSWTEDHTTPAGQPETKSIGKKKKSSKVAVTDRLSVNEPKTLGKREGVKQTLKGAVTTAEEAGIASADIIKTWERLFEVPIRVGGFANKRAAGIYKILPEVVRRKEKHYANLAVAAHEVAHHMDKQTNIAGADPRQPPTIPSHLRKEVAGLDYEPKGRLFEGFAEFVRHYLTEEDAHLLAPEFHKWFKETWMPLQPKWEAALKQARQQARQYADQTVLQRISSAIGRPGDDLEWSARFKARTLAAGKRAAQNLIDRGEILREIQEEVTQRGGERPDKAGVYDTFLAYDLTSDAYASQALETGVHALTDGRKLSDGLWKLSKELKNDVERQEAVAYAWAKHTLFMAHKRPNYNTGLDIEDAARMVQYVQGDPDKQARYDRLSVGLAQYANGTLEMLVDAGALAPATRDKILDFYGENYFPLLRMPEGQPATFGGARFVNLPKAVRGRSRGGSGRPIMDPFDALVTLTMQRYSRAIKARVAHSLVESLDPRFGGVEGMGGLLDQIDPKKVVHQGTVEEILNDLVKEGVVDTDDARAMRIAKRILTGEPISKRSREWFAKRHHLKPDDNLIPAAKSEPDILTTISLWRNDFSPRADKATFIYHDRQGNPHLYEADRFLYDTATGMDGLQFGAFMTSIRSAAQVFKAGAVGLSTGFGTANLIRDYFEYQGRAEHVKHVASLGKPLEMVARYIGYKARQLAGKPTNNALMETFEAAGGKLFSRLGTDMAARQRLRKRKLGQGTNILKQPWHIKDLVLTGTEGIQELIAWTDAPPRMAEMEAVGRKLGYEARGADWVHIPSGQKANLPEHVRIKMLVAAGEATINFKRIGSAGRYVDAFLPFANATLQASYREARQVKGVYKAAKSLGKDTQNTQRALRYLVYLSAASSTSFLVWLLRHVDDDYREQEPWLKEGYWTWGKGGKTYVRVPKPRDAAGLVANLTEASLDAWYHDDAEGAITGAIGRHGLGRLPAGGGLPRAAVETLVADYDYFRGRDLTPDYLKDEPKALQFDPYTLETSKAIGRITGERIGMSPIQAQHLLDGATGGAYRRWADAAEATYELRVGPEHVPFLRGVVINRHQARSLDDFYTEWNRVKLQAKWEEATDKLSVDTQRKKALLDDYGALMAEIRKADERDLKGRRKFLYETYLVGLAREALGREPLENNPSPFAEQELPAPVRKVLVEFSEQKAKAAILSHGYPTKKHEGDKSYEETVQKWRDSQKADEAWLKKHKDSPLVEQALSTIRRSKPYRDLLTRRGKPEYQGHEGWEQHLAELQRWMAKVAHAQKWLGEPE